MKTVMTRFTGLVLLAAAVTLHTLSQEMDWKKFDPKKLPPREAARLMEEYNRMIDEGLKKVTGDPREIKSLIMSGNKITTIVYNYGTITRPNTLYNTADLVWNRLGYGFEFTCLVGAEVTDASGQVTHILDDGMWLNGQGDYSPTGGLKYGWLPKPGYAAPAPNLDIAAWSQRAKVGGDLTRKPPAWPESWYNPVLGRYVWPAYLGNDATSPDEEVYFVCDDYTNAEFTYYPFPDDSTKRGLGLDLEVRFFQFNNPLAEDIIFLVYRVTNRSPKTLEKVYFGMYGDPHVGGGTSDFNDDRAFFIPPRGPYADPYPQRARSMVYAWDNNNMGEGGIVPGYFGFKFLESPTNHTDGIDNDDDGIIDESPFNDAGVYIDGVTLPLSYGIADTVKYKKVYGALRPRWSGDENGNWRPEKDDVGLDGLPGTGDEGEGNGKPDVGVVNGNITAEPNFGIRDVNESDQIGLTSFWALPYGGNNFPINDELFWEKLASDSIDINQELFAQEGDNIFLYGSGPFRLEPGATQRFSIALMMGENLPDLLLNSETAQRILESNYQFAQPPPKPIVHAVPGDKRVTLYWDNAAESTTDPLTATNDFEGYKIYRSQDYTFSDVFQITDANGSAFLGVPLKGADGTPAQFDLVNEWSGLHPVEYLGRGVKYQLGTNSGLVHEYVDSTVTNGVQYYYAVASYDHGFDSLGIALPPTESQISITRDPITGEFTFDVNTVAVTPGPPSPGTADATAGKDADFRHTAGNGTGVITLKIMDGNLVTDGAQYKVDFDTSRSRVVYDVETLQPLTEEVVGKDTLYVPLAKKNLVDTSFVLKDAGGNTVNPSSYYLDAPQGRFRGTSPGSITDGATYTASYRYHPISASTRLNSEDDNPVFDGVKIFVQDDVTGIDSLGGKSRWIVPGDTTTLVGGVQKPQSLTSLQFYPAPLDIEVRWNNTDTTANGKWTTPGDTLLNNNSRKVVVCPFRIVNVTDTTTIRAVVDNALRDSVWKPGREIVILTPSRYAPPGRLGKMMGFMFSSPASGQTILPTAGDIYRGATTKPFDAEDQFEFTTRAPVYKPSAQAGSVLDLIYVVPNPYVAYSSLEEPGSSPTLRGENRLQFRNLPPVCTIRIYTLLGELVDTINKNDSGSIADWQILSYEGQRLAYGVYLYHVDAPGVGEKIGRFALIK